MSTHQNFDVQQELRHLAEENVERARQLFLHFIEGAEKAMALWLNPSSDLNTSFDEMRKRSIESAKGNAEAAFNLAKDIAKAKDLSELVNLQTRYVQYQIKWYADQTKDFGQVMAGTLSGLNEAQHCVAAAMPSGSRSAGQAPSRNSE